MKDSKTYRKKVSCSTLKIIVDTDKKGKPEEIRIIPSKEGGCKANIGAIADLTNALIQIGKIDLAIESLKDHNCPACAVARAKKKKEEEEIDISCPDAIAKVLKEYLT